MSQDHHSPSCLQTVLVSSTDIFALSVVFKASLIERAIPHCTEAMASTPTGKTAPIPQRAPPTLLTIPPELRTQIFTNVFRLDQPLKPRCPYYRAYSGIMCMSTLMWWKILKYPSDPSNPIRPEAVYVR